MSRPSLAGELRRRGGRPRLLVRTPNWVGDAVMALPALDAVRASLPEAELVVLSRRWVADVASLWGRAERVVPLLEPGEHAGLAGLPRVARMLRDLRLDAAVLLPNAFGSALQARLAGIPLRGGYAVDARSPLLTHSIPAPAGRRPRGHQVESYLALARELGFDAPVDAVPRLPAPEGTRRGRGLVALAPGATYGSAKLWPEERWIDLGSRLAARGCRPVVLGSAAERDMGGRIAAGIGPAAEDLTGKTTLREAAARLASSALAVSNDSGLMHLAAALGTPLVALFGSTDPTATGPVSPASLVVEGEAGCAPCFRRRCPLPEGRGRMGCFAGVTVDRVEAACLQLLDRGEDAGGA